MATTARGWGEGAMVRAAGAAASLAAAALVAGCGRNEPPPPAPPPAAAAKPPPAAKAATAPPAGSASAEDVARAARGDLRCPAPAAEARPAGAPVDDIVGVRPGIRWEEAAQIALCTHPLMVAQPDRANRFSIQTYGQPIRQGLYVGYAQPRVQRSGQEVMRDIAAGATARGSNKAAPGMPAGQSRWYVGTIGLPGEERVTHVQREERFAEDALPPIATVEQALRAKYGEPTSRAASSGGVELVWAHDPSGKRQPSRHMGSGCSVIASVGAGVSLQEQCGVVVAASVKATPGNPDIAHSLTVASVDQARGLARVQQTEQRLAEADAQRRARELQDASRKAKGPTL